MTDYRAILETETDPNAPIIAALMKALARNPVAITEGASLAPRIQEPAVDNWMTTADGIKTYVFAYSTSGDTSFGSTRAGSSLRPTSASRRFVPGSSTPTWVFNSGSALSGTWRCMGEFDDIALGTTGGQEVNGATLWVRIS